MSMWQSAKIYTCGALFLACVDIYILMIICFSDRPFRTRGVVMKESCFTAQWLYIVMNVNQDRQKDKNRLLLQNLDFFSP